MSTSLNGFRYIGDVEPAQGYAGYQWFNTTTGIINEWTGTNVYPDESAGTWQNIYVNNLDNGGLLPIQGGSVTGAITGPAGWASSDNYNFPTSLKVSGQNVATVAYVNQQVTSFNDLISAKISQAISSATSSINTNANVAKYGVGTLGNGYFEPTAAAPKDTAPDAFAPIPLPKYPDGGLAASLNVYGLGLREHKPLALAQKMEKILTTITQMQKCISNKLETEYIRDIGITNISEMALDTELSPM